MVLRRARLARAQGPRTSSRSPCAPAPAWNVITFIVIILLTLVRLTCIKHAASLIHKKSQLGHFLLRESRPTRCEQAVLQRTGARFAQTTSARILKCIDH